MYQQTYNIVPSAYGFKSIRPRSRVERKNSNDKVALEKNRINMRVGINARIQRANAPETSAGLTTCDTTGAGYISNVHRFHSDTCGDEMLRRKQELLAKSRGVQYRQHQNEQRDAIRWQREDDNNRREEQYWQGVRDTGEGCPKNLSAVGYDITSLAYHNDLKGDCAKYEDDMIRYRAKVRTVRLVNHGGSRSTYNIINGGERHVPQLPPTITPPTGYFHSRR